MATSSESTSGKPKLNGVDVVHTEPSSRRSTPLGSQFKIVFQLTYAIVMFIPVLIWSIFEYVFTKSKDVEGKVVLVTGSAHGLGRGYAEEFARLGCKVACADIDDDLNRQTVEEINKKYPRSAKAYKCNVAASDEVKELKEAVMRDFGCVNILINNAGLVRSTPLIDLKDDYLDRILGVNLKGNFLTVREFLPDMIQRNEGHIVAIASISALTGVPNLSVYAASKHGILGLMECLYCDLQAYPDNQIKTTTICPYFVNTRPEYSKSWKLSYGAMSVETAVKASVNAVRKNRRIVTIPSGFYFALMFSKLLPDRLLGMFHQVFKVKISSRAKNNTNTNQKTDVQESSSNSAIESTILP